MKSSAKERGLVQFGNTRLHYVVHRRIGRKTATVSVSPEGKVCVIAPGAATRGELRDAVQRRARWVLAQLDETRQRTTAPRHRFSSGQTIRYAGRQYRLVIRTTTGVASPKIALRGGDLVAAVARNGRQNDRLIRDALVSWMRTTSRSRIERLFRQRLSVFGLGDVAMQIRELGKRWGSCTAGSRVLLNWRVATLPARLATYVVDHELTHIRHPNHSPAFWKALSVVCPTFDRCEAQLRLAETSLWR